MSLCVDLACFAALAFVPGPIPFIIATAAMSAGSGAAPALQSVALSLSSPADAGKVLAGLGVVQSLMSSIAGPLLYGSVYALTIDVFPTAIFVLGGATFVLAQLALAFVRFPSRTQHTRDSFSALSRHEAEALQQAVKRQQQRQQGQGGRGRDAAQRDLGRRSSAALTNDSGVSMRTT